jgi:transposase-like protein
MSFPIEIKGYEEFEKLMGDLVILKCSNCKWDTIHYRRGFNPRFECLKCGKEWKYESQS